LRAARTQAEGATPTAAQRSAILTAFVRLICSVFVDKGNTA
jgi:hypothetical protein